MECSERQNLVEKYPDVKDWIKNMPQDIWGQCRVIRCGRGKTLFQRGEKVEFVYIICDGTIMISSSNLNGNEMGIVFVTNGSSVGEMEVLLSTESLLYNAKVFSQSILLQIPSKAFKHWIDCDTTACKKMAYILAEKLYSASSSTVKYKHLEAIVRVKMLLSNHGTGKVWETREELAEACGVSERTIHRVIATLVAEGKVTCKSGKIEISEQQLEQIEDSILEEI